LCYLFLVAGEAFKQSKEAVAELIAARKLEEKRRRELRERFDQWERRAREAEAAGEHERARQALSRCDELAEADAASKAQILRLQKEISLAEAQLRKIAVREERSIDAEALLASLEAATGPADPQKRKMEKLQEDEKVEAELKRLKDLLNKESQ
jgi:phage shock protein A